ncbi:type IV pilus modification PilV family protein [Legionella londiniensis]|uniref:Tfp pilus assembly protein PilV n=1 Tax=Legionella londiniensis TaxID=45068 RepID=A0A0W0VNU2_9GAMM|nr:type II secretion system protein [Legionella londiniensis]KTD21835.1 hypothetical protein Llon_1000 [Legionella londiniensis]STX92682.1 Tfp pilus assembly protein PilV [Legionella londiniensis]
MDRQKGFSLAEVLISLLLMSTASLALLQQQWQANQLLNQITRQTNTLLQLDNASEQYLYDANHRQIDNGFSLIRKKLKTTVKLGIQCKFSLPDECRLSRELRLYERET